MIGKVNAWFTLCVSAAVLRLWEPAALRGDFGYSQLIAKIQSIGTLPVGRSITGTLSAVSSAASCASVFPFSSSNSATPIVILREGGCPWELKLLHAQEAGAALALMVDSDGEEAQLEGKGIIERIKIPSVVVDAAKVDLLERALATQERSGPVTLVAEFYQLEAHQSVEIRFRATIDQAASYDALLLLQRSLQVIDPPPRLSLTFETCASNPAFASPYTNCVNGSQSFCIASAAVPPQSELLEATIALLCLMDEAPGGVFEALKQIRDVCFNTAGAPISDFSSCARREAARSANLSRCVASATRRKILWAANLQQDRIGGASPLIFINGQLLHKKSINPLSLLQAVCEVYALPIAGCPKLVPSALPRTSEVRKLLSVGIVCSILALVCLTAVLWMLRVFYQRRMKREFNNQLSERINAALEKYYGHSASDYRTAPGPRSP